MEQSGIYTITLKENKETSLIYTAGVVTITTTGQNISIENNQEIKLTFTPQRTGNNKQLYQYNLSWFIYDISEANISLINQIISSIYGWIAEIEFYNGDKKAILAPLRFQSSNSDTNVSASYLMEMANPVLGRELIASSGGIISPGIGTMVIGSTFIIG